MEKQVLQIICVASVVGWPSILSLHEGKLGVHTVHHFETLVRQWFSATHSYASKNATNMFIIRVKSSNVSVCILYSRQYLRPIHAYIYLYEDATGIKVYRTDFILSN